MTRTSLVLFTVPNTVINESLIFGISMLLSGMSRVRKISNVRRKRDRIGHSLGNFGGHVGQDDTQSPRSWNVADHEIRWMVGKLETERKNENI